MQEYIFGVACTMLRTIGKKQHAMHATHNKEAILKTIKHNHYVDDFVASFENKQTAYKISSEVKKRPSDSEF